MANVNYPPDMRRAASRHWAAAEALRDKPERRVAGYLYGIACECAVKQRMIEVGLQPPRGGRTGPFYAHYPEIRGLLADAIEGRGAAGLRRCCEPSFLNEWDVAMRYSDGTKINDAKIERWREDARYALEELEL
jgi:hypothetical protein